MLLSALLKNALEEFNCSAASTVESDFDDEAILNTYQSDIYFGLQVGTVSMKQVSPVDYNNRCLSINSKTSDSTGLRVYTGSHVALRCLGHLYADYQSKHSEYSRPVDPPACEQVSGRSRRVVELGAGCGALSAIASHLNIVDILLDLPLLPSHASFSAMSKLVITDGNFDSIEIAKYNHKRYGNSKVDTSFDRFLWSDAPTEVLGTSGNFAALDRLLSLSVGGDGLVREPFDLVIGIETFYYKVDVVALMTEVLILLGALENRPSTAFAGDGADSCSEAVAAPPLSSSSVEFVPRMTGMFFHAHHFRGSGNQEQQIIDFLAHFGWSTVEIPLDTFMPKGECGADLAAADAMGCCRCLVSASNDTVEELLRLHPEWVRFSAYARGDDPELDQPDGEGDNDFLYR